MLSNVQYDEIMRGYDAVQLRNRRISQDRHHLVCLKSPRVKEIEDTIASASVSAARRKFEGDTAAFCALQTEIAALRQEKAEILRSLELPADYLNPVYDCPDCKDTGYIGNEKCHCLRQAIINTVYAQSNIRPVLERENFSNLSMEYYSKTMKSRATGLSSYETMEKAVKACHTFIDHFDQKPKNLFFYGDTGVGKTFLSNCVAKELLDKGYSVLYFTAFQMFDILNKEVFDRDSDAIEAHRNIFDCDLLIIDDLGTELSNSFTASQLFLCINERILRRKSTIISTNLGINAFLERYSERTSSRIFSSYTILNLFGDDIRTKQRR